MSQLQTPLQARRAPLVRWGGRDGSASVSSHAAHTFSALASYVFGALHLNIMLAIGALPLVLLLLLAADPFSAPPALLAAVYLAMPIVTVAFCAFRDSPAFRVGLSAREGAGEDSWWSSHPDQSLLRPALHVLRRTGLRTLGATALPMALALILVVDARWALDHAWGFMLFPAFLLGAALALSTAFNTAALISERADAPWHVLLRIAAFGVLRSWPLSLLNLAVMGIAVMGLIWQPLLCWVLASSLVLYVIWAGSRWSILPTVSPRAG